MGGDIQHISKNKKHKQNKQIITLKHFELLEKALLFGAPV